MPRTTKVDSPGCPPIRALTFDSLGLIKVIEASGKQGEVPKVLERWGEPDTSRCVLTASIIDREIDPLLAVARKNGLIEVLSPINGDIRVSMPNVSHSQVEVQHTDDDIVGLHLFKKQRAELSSRSCTLLTCTTKGHASVRSVVFPNSPGEPSSTDTPSSWNVCAAGNIYCSKVHGTENYAVFGGKGVDVNVWDLETCTKIWNAKSPAKNSLGIFTPTWFTSATFLSNDDHRKFVTGTNSHQVRLYDLSAQRRPVLSFDFRETPIKSVAEDQDGNTLFIGNGSGDLASYDIRTGKLLGCFLGKCAGSIRSIVRHPNIPVIASCGLDSYLRIWDIKSRQLLSAIFLKQHLTGVVFDSHFKYEEVGNPGTPLQSNESLRELVEKYVEEEDIVSLKWKKSTKCPDGSKKTKSKKASKGLDDEEEEEAEDIVSLKLKKSSKGLNGSKKTKAKKPSRDLDDEEEEEEIVPPLKQKKASAKGLDGSRKKRTEKASGDVDEEEEDVKPLKRKKASKDDDGSKKTKSKKKNKLKGENADAS